MATKKMTLKDNVTWTYEVIFSPKVPHPQHVMLTPPGQLADKIKEFKLNPKIAVLFDIGTYGGNYYFKINDIGIPDPQVAIEAATTILGVGLKDYEKKVYNQEHGIADVDSIPSHGCFGFLNGHLILGNRHHQEIMNRLIEDAGWTWDDLMSADQVWGWYDAGSHGNVRFASDAGIMSSEDTKDACVKAFGTLWQNEIKFNQDAGGYDIKDKGYNPDKKSTSKDIKGYGGAYHKNYGAGGNKKGWEGTINYDITPLPLPPGAENEETKL